MSPACLSKVFVIISVFEGMAIGAWRQRLVLVRVVTATIGVRMSKRAAPLYLVLALLALLMFGKGGISRADLAQMLGSSPGLRAWLLLGWVFLSMPAALQLASGRELSFLLSMPVPRWQVAASLSLCLLTLHALWMALWASAGFAMALSALALSLGASAILASPGGSRFAAPVLAAALGAIAFAPPWGSILYGGATLFLGLSLLLRRAGEIDSRGSRVVRTRPALVALALAQWLRIWRREKMLLARGLLLNLLVAAIAGLAIVNNAISSPVVLISLALGIGATGVCVASYGVAVRLAEADLRETWFYQSLGVRPELRWRAASLVMTFWAITFGLLYSMQISHMANVETATRVQLALKAAVWFASLAVLILRLAFVWSQRKRDESPLVFAAAAVIIAASLAVGYFGQWALLQAAAVATFVGLFCSPPFEEFDGQRSEP